VVIYACACSVRATMRYLAYYSLIDLPKSIAHNFWKYGCGLIVLSAYTIQIPNNILYFKSKLRRPLLQNCSNNKQLYHQCMVVSNCAHVLPMWMHHLCGWWCIKCNDAVSIYIHFGGVNLTVKPLTRQCHPVFNIQD
jgi:hypothetical protein